MKTLDKPKLKRLRATATRTLKILELIEQGLNAQEIVSKLGVNRQLVDYYLRTLRQ